MTKEQLYHNSRITFAIIDNKLQFGPLGLSHAEWLIGLLGMNMYQFNKVIRGYYNSTGIYFYQGNFETNNKVELAALNFADKIDSNLPIYCGCIVGEVGEYWKPIKQLR